jgi:D-alanyl-D-alanine dipeptidase
MKWTVTIRDNLLNDPRVNPTAKRKFLAVLNDVRSKGLPLMVWEVYRSREQQRALYAQGRTDAELRKAGFTDDEIIQYRKQGYLSSKPVVTKILNPKYHGTGRAMDCCWLVEGKPSWNVPQNGGRRTGELPKCMDWFGAAGGK